MLTCPLVNRVRAREVAHQTDALVVEITNTGAVVLHAHVAGPREQRARTLAVAYDPARVRLENSQVAAAMTVTARAAALVQLRRASVVASHALALRRTAQSTRVSGRRTVRVEFTVRGLEDDSIAAERYVVRITRRGEHLSLVSLRLLRSCWRGRGSRSFTSSACW